MLLVGNKAALRMDNTTHMQRPEDVPGGLGGMHSLQIYGYVEFFKWLNVVSGMLVYLSQTPPG